MSMLGHCVALQADLYRALLTRNYDVLRSASSGKMGQQSLLNIVVQLRKVNHMGMRAI